MNLMAMLMAADRINSMPPNTERLALALELIQALGNSKLLNLMVEFEAARVAKAEAWQIRRAQQFAPDVKDLPVKADGKPYTYREVKDLYRKAEDRYDDATIALHDAIKENSTDE